MILVNVLLNFYSLIYRPLARISKLAAPHPVSDACEHLLLRIAPRPSHELVLEDRYWHCLPRPKQPWLFLHWFTFTSPACSLSLRGATSTPIAPRTNPQNVSTASAASLSLSEFSSPLAAQVVLSGLQPQPNWAERSLAAAVH